MVCPARASSSIPEKCKKCKHSSTSMKWLVETVGLHGLILLHLHLHIHGRSVQAPWGPGLQSKTQAGPSGPSLVCEHTHTCSLSLAAASSLLANVPDSSKGLCSLSLLRIQAAATLKLLAVLVDPFVGHCGTETDWNGCQTKVSKQLWQMRLFFSLSKHVANKHSHLFLHCKLLLTYTATSFAAASQLLSSLLLCLGRFK